MMVCAYIELFCWGIVTFAKIRYCFADIWGSFTDIKGSVADTQDCIRSTCTSRRNAVMVCAYIELFCWDKVTPAKTYFMDIYGSFMDL